MNTLSLTDTQRRILDHAIEHTAGRIDWFPDNIKGGARRKVLDGLLKRGLIALNGGDHCVTAEGFAAVGRTPPVPISPSAETEMPASNAEAAEANATGKRIQKSREDSKQAEVIRMLHRPEGATIPQICAETGWQAHTVRGVFAGAFKKKLGLTLVSEKPEGGDRIYKIA
ncbi:DUF3489 domain-containing protein [Methylococcus mesophilus]|uniref:DUF3489 domain-containing protein n=1 Tax=Methylococcus mesophilus TaxID=2993564 RepID=UPI00224AB6F1|nr:DUF3489 domain-containing protein [Methylococcus mesophilus]UZR28098.1 DUF3489 domain-containing protein [Methylococcus mesophilus]